MAENGYTRFFDTCGGDEHTFGAAHDEIVGEPVQLDDTLGGIAYQIVTVVDDEGRHIVQYADPERQSS